MIHENRPTAADFDVAAENWLEFRFSSLSDRQRLVAWLVGIVVGALLAAGMIGLLLLS